MQHYTTTKLLISVIQHLTKKGVSRLESKLRLLVDETDADEIHSAMNNIFVSYRQDPFIKLADKYADYLADFEE